MTVYEAPAKLNLSLLVEPPRSDGYHPLESLVQTVEWVDTLTVEEADEDQRVAEGIDLDDDENLAWKAWNRVKADHHLRPASLTLRKTIPAGGGLGGGSSDAAAALLAAVDHGGLEREVASSLAPELGADVPLFLTGGTLVMSGIGDVIERQQPLSGFAIAVVVPRFVLATADVYRRWDAMEGPEGEPILDKLVPPALRGGMPLRNDLLPAALDLEPELGDFLADIRSIWASPVLMTGSGSGCFGFFATVSEAADAAAAVPGCRAAVGVELRDRGAAISDD